MKEFKFFKGYVSNLFESIAFPMVRRVGARLIGDELVPVQPIEELPQPRTITRRIPNQNVGEIITDIGDKYILLNVNEKDFEENKFEEDEDI
jgi:hypothetical protein